MKKLLMLGWVSFLGLGLSLNANAQTPPVIAQTPPVNQVEIDTLASQFAMQAGTIAGVVQACGQSIVEYNSRVNEALGVLSKAPEEKMQAMTAYQKALSHAEQAENRTHSINCGEAMKSFNSLPLMQSDYKKTILPQMAKMATPESFAMRALPGGKPPVVSTATPPATSSVTPPTPGSQ